MSQLSGSKVIGITGTMGAGKSTAGRLLSRYIPVEDCDAINARLLLPQKAGYLALQKAGLLFTHPDGTLDKAALASAMFADTKIRQKVESILHPLIHEEMLAWIQAQSHVCAIEVPLLFESGMEGDFDEIWCVCASPQTALERLETGRHISRQEALARMKNQYSPQKKMENSQVILFNDGTPEELEEQIVQALENFCQRYPQKV